VAQKKGLSNQKPRVVPGKADSEKQEEFLNNTLIPLLDKADKDDNVKLYFGDAVHLIYGSNIDSCWSIERPVIKSSSGRARFNVMGFLDSETNETIVVSNDSYITATEIVESLKKLKEINEEKEVYIILDNARYQKCKLVKEAAEKYEINIVYLPPYSPNLNLIERLWKFLRKECLSNKYHLTFKEFGDSILGCLSETHTKHAKTLSSWLSHKFEIFK